MADTSSYSRYGQHFMMVWYDSHPEGHWRSIATLAGVAPQVINILQTILAPRVFKWVISLVKYIVSMGIVIDSLG